jgi:hypothetical protein
MTLRPEPRPNCVKTRSLRTTIAALALLILPVSISGIGLPACAQDAGDDALQILKAMSDYLASQKNISAMVDSDIEVVTPDLGKIQFNSSTEVALQRPDKLRVARKGGYADVELVFNGKTLSILGKNLNAFAQFEAEGSVDQLVQRLRDDYSLDVPGADLLLSNVYDELTADILTAKHIGQGVIDGVECEHLAFRNHDDLDWQLWVETGPTPIPKKFVITSKSTIGAPQYTLRIREWKTADQLAASEFSFQAPAGATKLDRSTLASLDEIPPMLDGGNP